MGHGTAQSNQLIDQLIRCHDAPQTAHQSVTNPLDVQPDSVKFNLYNFRKSDNICLGDTEAFLHLTEKREGLRQVRFR